MKWNYFDAIRSAHVRRCRQKKPEKLLSLGYLLVIGANWRRRALKFTQNSSLKSKLQTSWDISRKSLFRLFHTSWCRLFALYIPGSLFGPPKILNCWRSSQYKPKMKPPQTVASIGQLPVPFYARVFLRHLQKKKNLKHCDSKSFFFPQVRRDKEAQAKEAGVQYQSCVISNVYERSARGHESVSPHVIDFYDKTGSHSFFFVSFFETVSHGLRLSFAYRLDTFFMALCWRVLWRHPKLQRPESIRAELWCWNTGKKRRRSDGSFFPVLRN